MPRKDPVPAGWYPDRRHQWVRHRVRYWNGDGWTPWVVDDSEPFVEHERKFSFDHCAALHPLWTAIAWGLLYWVVFTAAARLGSGDWHYARASAVPNAIGAAVLAPAIVWMTRRRLRRPPRLHTGASPN